MRARLVAATAVAGLVLPVLPATAVSSPDEAAARTEARTVTIRGHGYGHGRGLSQWGAQKAARDGKGYRRILRFYYPHTRFGSRGGRLRVLITGDTGQDLVVGDRDGLRVRSLASGRTWRLRESAATRWRIRPADGGRRSVISYRSRSWHHWRTVRGAAEFHAGGAPIVLRAESGRTRYRGTLRSARTGHGRDTVNILPLEQYLRGVVPQEVPALWEPAAVRAQSVAARTYAAYERAHHRRRYYHLCDTTSCQVYGGRSAEHSASDAAIRATRKRVVTRGGDPIFAQFSASSGGWTVDHPDFRYLQAKPDPWDDWSGNPYHRWRVRLTARAIERQWPAVGRLRGIRVLSRDGNGQWNGRILWLRLRGSDGRVRVSGDEFRVRLGLRSTWLRITTSW